MYEKTRDILYPNPAIRVKQVSDKGIASIGVSVILQQEIILIKMIKIF